MAKEDSFKTDTQLQDEAAALLLDRLNSSLSLEINKFLFSAAKGELQALEQIICGAVRYTRREIEHQRGSEDGE